MKCIRCVSGPKVIPRVLLEIQTSMSICKIEVHLEEFLQGTDCGEVLSKLTSVERAAMYSAFWPGSD